MNDEIIEYAKSILKKLCDHINKYDVKILDRSDTGCIQVIYNYNKMHYLLIFQHEIIFGCELDQISANIDDTDKDEIMDLLGKLREKAQKEVLNRMESFATDLEIQCNKIEI